MSDIYVAEPKKETVLTPPNEDKTKIGLENLDLVETQPIIASFATLPTNVHFETQELEEKIILLLRMHWVTNIPWITMAILLMVSPVILNYFPLFDFLPARYQLMGLILWYLLTTAFIIEQFLTWFFNVYIITDERIVDIDFYGLLHREISDAKIDKIQDVSVRWPGIASTIFNYGDIFIQTASERPKFEFHAVPSPERVAKILQGLRTQEEIEVLEGRIR